MADKTVTIGDTEVRIEETDDGFEVTETEDKPESETGLWLRASTATHGCEIPLEADFTLVNSGAGYCIAWKTDDDRSALKSGGSSTFDFDEDKYDGHAYVTDIELVRD